MTASLAKRRLDPTYFTHPEYVQTYGPEVAELATLAGFPPDPEQELGLDVLFAIRENGVPLVFEFAVVAPRQNLKALDVDTPLLTESGWTTMGAIQVGDRVFHPAGHLVDVTHTSDVTTGHQCYRVTTTDGRSVIADAGHLWSVDDRRTNRTRVMQTWELLAEGLQRSSAGQRSTKCAGKRYTASEFRFRVPVQEPLKSADIALPLDPYLFGAWLGDGNSKGATLSSHADDVPHWRSEIERAGYIPTVHADRTCSAVGITTTPGPGRQSRSFAGALRRLGVLRNKHVPDLYLTAGANQREALLQGLLDTDGTVHHRSGQVTFTSTRSELADAVLYLVRSLGWRAGLHTGRALLRGRDCGPKYTVTFTPKQSDPFMPFRMERKAQRVGAVDGGKGRFAVSISSIEPVLSRPVRCIKVDSPDGLYLAGRDLLATHNTGLLKMAVLGWLFITDQQLIVWSAHDMTPTEEAFRDLSQLITDCPSMSKRLAPGPSNGIFRGNGDESIELETGQRVLFKARTAKGGTRGLAGDKVILDEAFALAPVHMGNLLPTLAAREHSQVAYGSSAGKANSAILRRIRDRGRAGGSASLGYMEYCAPKSDCALEDCSHEYELVQGKGCALDNRDHWRVANSALGRRITWEKMQAFREAEPPEEFMREHMSWWEDPAGTEVIPTVFTEDQWLTCKDPNSQPNDPVAFGVFLLPDRSAAAIAVAGRRTDWKIHTEIVPARRGGTVHTLPGTAWIAPRLKELKDDFGPCAVLVAGAADSLIAAITDLGIEVITVNGMDRSRACGQFYDAVTDAGDGDDPTLRHLGGQEFHTAATTATKRELRNGWVWADGTDVQLEAATVAVHGLIEHGPDAPVETEVWGFWE